MFEKSSKNEGWRSFCCEMQHSFVLSLSKAKLIYSSGVFLLVLNVVVLFKICIYQAIVD